MNRKKKEKNFWLSYFGVSTSALVPENIRRLPWKEQSATDEDLDFLSQRIKSIHQMDLDYNLITNKGIEYLTRMNIEELRLKGLNIDNDSIFFLQQISGLKLLHIGGTNITSEGISNLSSLSTLETLICTPDPLDAQHLRRFKESLPQCELIVNYKIFEE